MMPVLKNVMKIGGCSGKVRLVNKDKCMSLLRHRGFRLVDKMHYSFSSTNQNNDFLDQYSFEQLILLKSTQSLTKAAQKMAVLQIQHESLVQQIASIEQKILNFPDHHQALMQRIKSMMDNINLQEQQNKSIQNRAQKQLIDSRSYAISKVARQTLQISDNLQRSIKHAQKICAATHSQTKRFHKQLLQLLKQFGIQSFNPTNQPFDPNTQQSLQKISPPQNLSQQQKLKKSNTVADCIRTGYLIKGRLLRSAHVVLYQ